MSAFQPGGGRAESLRYYNRVPTTIHTIRMDANLARGAATSPPDCGGGQQICDLDRGLVR